MTSAKMFYFERAAIIRSASKRDEGTKGSRKG